jgi:acyl-CoA thioesterase II
MRGARSAGCSERRETPSRYHVSAAHSSRSAMRVSRRAGRCATATTRPAIKPYSAYVAGSRTWLGGDREPLKRVVGAGLHPHGETKPLARDVTSAGAERASLPRCEDMDWSPAARHSIGPRPGAEDLEQATHVEPSDGGHVAELSDAWEIWGPNGGYLAAIALRAAGDVAQIDRPASFYCHFLSSPSFDAVELSVDVLKRGRRAESLAVRMTQEDKPILHAMVKTAADAPGYSHQHPAAPDASPPEALKSYDELLPAERRPRFSFWENIERRPLDQRTTDEPKEPVIREWARFRPRACFDDPFLDAARALILLDTYGFPAAYQRYRSWQYLAPNLDSSAWFHDFSPACEWLLIDSECGVADHGLMGVGGRVWDTDGRLLATGAAQLCCIPGDRT